MDLEDSSSSNKATICGQPAEKLLKCNAKKRIKETSLVCKKKKIIINNNNNNNNKI